MRKSIILIIAASTIALTSCFQDSYDVKNTSEKPELINEMRGLAVEMSKEIINPSKAYLLGNVAFKSYDSLTVSYDSGKEKNTKTFVGSVGYVKIENLTSDTLYKYSISTKDGLTIANGTFRTSK